MYDCGLDSTLFVANTSVQLTPVVATQTVLQRYSCNTVRIDQNTVKVVDNWYLALV